MKTDNICLLLDYQGKIISFLTICSSNKCRCQNSNCQFITSLTFNEIVKKNSVLTKCLLEIKGVGLTSVRLSRDLYFTYCNSVVLLCSHPNTVNPFNLATIIKVCELEVEVIWLPFNFVKLGSQKVPNVILCMTSSFTVYLA